MPRICRRGRGRAGCSASANGSSSRSASARRRSSSTTALGPATDVLGGIARDACSTGGRAPSSAHAQDEHRRPRPRSTSAARSDGRGAAREPASAAAAYWIAAAARGDGRARSRLDAAMAGGCGRPRRPSACGRASRRSRSARAHRDHPGSRARRPRARRPDSAKPPTRWSRSGSASSQEWVRGLTRPRSATIAPPLDDRTPRQTPPHRPSAHGAAPRGPSRPRPDSSTGSASSSSDASSAVTWRTPRQQRVRQADLEHAQPDQRQPVVHAGAGIGQPTGRADERGDIRFPMTMAVQRRRR